jgi:hypothetical protein
MEPSFHITENMWTLHYKLNSSNVIEENCGLFFYENQLKIFKKNQVPYL